MRVYHERLTVPISWWLGGLFTVITFGSIVWGGFSLLIGGVVYVGLLAGLAVLLLPYGQVAIEVTDGRLRAGKLDVPLTETGEVRALDAKQAQAMRGPRADPAAAMLLRPYLHEAVYVASRDDQDPPYWLIATRRPAELADAIENSRTPAAADGTAVG
jgi:Protein of unknown function (DUF3093)